MSEGVKLTKNVNPDKYLYSGYGIGFDTPGYHSLPDGSVGKNVIIFEVDMSSSVHSDNKGKDVLIRGKGPTQRLNRTLTAETRYSIIFTRPGIMACIVMGAAVSYLLMLQKYISSKQKILK